MSLLRKTTTHPARGGASRGRMPRAAAVVTVAMAGLSVAGCAGGGQGGEEEGGLVTVNYAEIGTSATSWPLYIGEDKGFFESNGIRFTPIVTKQPSQAIAALIAKQAQFANSGTPDIIASIDKGSSLKIVASQGAASPYSILASKDVATWSDLQGSTVIGDETHGITTYYFEKAAEENGLAEGDLQFTFAGSTADRYAALVGGAVDGAIISPPTMFSAIDEGYTDLGAVNEFIGPTPFNVVAVNEEWAEQNHEGAVGFLRAYAEACAWLNDPENREEAGQILQEHANASPEEADRTYDYFQEIGMFPSEPTVTTDSLAPLLDDFVAYGTVTQKPQEAEAYLNGDLLAEALEG